MSENLAQYDEIGLAEVLEFGLPYIVSFNQDGAGFWAFATWTSGMIKDRDVVMAAFAEAVAECSWGDRVGVETERASVSTKSKDMDYQIVFRPKAIGPIPMAPSSWAWIGAVKARLSDKMPGVVHVVTFLKGKTAFSTVDIDDDATAPVPDITGWTVLGYALAGVAGLLALFGLLRAGRWAAGK